MMKYVKPKKLGKKKIWEIRMYLSDYGMTVYETPIKDLCYVDGIDRHLIQFLIDYFISEKIEYFWFMGGIHFYLKE